VLGIALYGAQLSHRDAVDLARGAEERGLDAVFVAETFPRPHDPVLEPLASGGRGGFFISGLLHAPTPPPDEAL
jgi:hypothetical protein